VIFETVVTTVAPDGKPRALALLDMLAACGMPVVPVVIADRGWPTHTCNTPARSASPA
jgi:hypothetical protein